MGGVCLVLVLVSGMGNEVSACVSHKRGALQEYSKYQQHGTEKLAF